MNVSYYCEHPVRNVARSNLICSLLSIDGFGEHPTRFPQTAVHRAATLIRATMLFRQQFKLGEVKPEATRDGPMCMDTWR